MFHTRFQTEQQHRDTRCADIPSPWSPSAWFKLQMQANGDRNYPRDPDEALAEARHIMDHYFKLYQREGRTSDAPLADTLNPRFLSDHYLAHDEIAAMTPRDPGLNINGKTRKTIGELKKFQAVLRRERYEVAQNEVMVRRIIYFVLCLGVCNFIS